MLSPHVFLTPQKASRYCAPFGGLVLGRGLQTMPTQHQYSVGETVHYLSSPRDAYRAPGVYRIVRLLPIERSDCQYWIRSALENFDRVAFEWELGVIRSHPDTRVTRQLVTFPAPFQLKGMEEARPAGIYEITTEEETIGDFIYEAYRRISTTLYLPPQSGDYGVGKFVPTDPAEVAQAMKLTSA